MTNVLKYPSPEALDATTIYAVGDIHGRLDLLLALEEIIMVDIAKTKAQRPVLCFLGDYINRGPNSAQVIEHLSKESSPQIPRVFLKGNQDDRMMAFLREPELQGAAWLGSGAKQTFESYGIWSSKEQAKHDRWKPLRDDLVVAMPPAHHRFLVQLRLAFVWRNFVFVHAGIDPESPLESQTERDLMWIKEPFLRSTKNFGPRIVHGHVKVAEPEFHPNRIAIDTGAHESGRLTCLVVNANESRILQAIV